MNEQSQFDEPIWSGLYDFDSDGPYLIGSKCDLCGFLSLGMRGYCPNCWRKDGLNDAKLGRQGRIYTYTTVYQPAPGFSDQYTVGYIDIEEQVRVFAHLVNGAHLLRIGEEVMLAIKPIKVMENGQYQFGPVYTAVTNNDG